MMIAPKKRRMAEFLFMVCFLAEVRSSRPLTICMPLPF